MRSFWQMFKQAKHQLLDNPHVVGITGRIEITKDGLVARVLVVTTDLEMNAFKVATYDDAALRLLADQVKAALSDQYDRGDIVPVSSGSQ